MLETLFKMAKQDSESVRLIVASDTWDPENNPRGNYFLYQEQNVTKARCYIIFSSVSRFCQSDKLQLTPLVGRAHLSSSVVLHLFRLRC